MARKDAVRHRTKVASHTETPLGVSNQRSLFAKRGKVNGWFGIAPIITACPWVGDMSSVCPLPNGKVSGVWCRSFQPFRSPYGGSCMAGYHCLMPTAFLSAATQYIIKQPTAFSFAAANISTVNFYLITTFLSFSINMPLLGLA